MYSFKTANCGIRHNLLPLSLVVVGATCIAVWGWSGLFYAVRYYILSACVASTFTQTAES